ncbi:NAD(P)-dependent oxidoreductase [soil metagenome]
MTEDSRPVIGFVGVGNMGRPMVAALIEAGNDVIVHDRDAAVAASVASETGAGAASDLASLGAASDIIILMLPDGKIVAEVVLGAGGIADGLSPGALIIDMSSSFPPGTVELGARLAARGIELVDAPVSGGVRRAVTASLAIIAGGEEAAVSRAAPVLEAMGSVIRTGPLGSGHAMKALNNFVSAAGLAAACEALLIGERFGLDPEVIVDVLNASSGRNTATETKLRQFVLSGSFGSGFAASLMAKDIRAAEDLAESLDVAAPMLAFSTELWKEAAAALEPGADHTAMFRHLSSLSRDAVSVRVANEAADASYL